MLSIFNTIKGCQQEVSTKGETRLLFSLTSYINMERNSNISCGNSVACASESYEKYVFQNLILLQVLRALMCPHFLPGRCLRGRSESTPCPCCSGGMGLTFRSRIWAQRLNQVQQRCLIPWGFVLGWRWGWCQGVFRALCWHRRCGSIFSNSSCCLSLESACVILLTCPLNAILHVWLKLNSFLLLLVLRTVWRVWALSEGRWGSTQPSITFRLQ